MIAREIRDQGLHPLVFFYVFGILLTAAGLARGVTMTEQRFLGNEVTPATVALSNRHLR